MLTSDAAIEVLDAITCAPVTRTIRGIRSEVEVGAHEGLAEACAITCDNLLTIPVDRLDGTPVGHLSLHNRAELDAALRYALDIAF